MPVVRDGQWGTDSIQLPIYGLPASPDLFDHKLREKVLLVSVFA